MNDILTNNELTELYKIANRVDSIVYERASFSIRTNVIGFSKDIMIETFYRNKKHSYTIYDCANETGLIIDKIRYELCIFANYVRAQTRIIENSIYGLTFDSSDKNYIKNYIKNDLNTIFGVTSRLKNEIIDVIFNDPATIVFWGDGTKTVVKCGEDDKFDKEKGLAMAIAKHFMGTNKSKSNYCDIFKKWCEEE